MSLIVDVTLPNEMIENINEVNNDNNPTQERADGGKMISKSEYIIKCIEFYRASEGIGFEEKSKRYKTIDNKIYLGEGLSMEVLRWELMQRQKPTIFLLDLAMCIWKPDDLANRALDLRKPISNLPGRNSPVKIIEEEKLRLLISLYHDFLHRQDQINTLKKTEFLLNVTYNLRMKIRNLRAKAKKGNNNNRIRRHLIYNFVR